MAHAYVDAIADAGADAVKFQTHIAAAESTAAEPWRVRFSDQDDTRYDYWKRMEFSEEQWRGLKRHAMDRELHFLSSPFSDEAVALLSRVGVAAWKVASGEVNNAPMFDQMAETGRPFMVSTGMSSIEEIDEAVDRVKRRSLPLAILQCTTRYPCPPELVGLNLVSSFRERYGVASGLSDHSGTIYPSLSAVTLGAEVIEVHVTMSREMFGPDVAASISTNELRVLVDGVRFIEQALVNPVDKDALAEEMTPLREMFGKSIVARTDLPTGTVLESKHLAVKKPGFGIPPTRLNEVLGRRLRRPAAADALLLEEDLELLQ